MNKKFVILFAAVLACFLLAACAQPIVIPASDGAAYEVTSVKRANEYDDAAPSAGNAAFVTVEIQGDSIDGLQNTFFGVGAQPASISDGSTAIPCSFVSYQPAGIGAAVTLVFEVPESFPKTFALSGETFSPVTLRS